MPKGIGDIPELKLETLQGLIEKFVAPPNMFVASMFPEENYPSNNIKWESVVGTYGLAPFKAPGAKTHVTAPTGYAENSATAAFWGEKMFMDENYLNNLRKLGTLEEYETAQAKLARNTQLLVNRVRRRKEWMFAKMLFAGSFAYKEEKGYMCSVSYDRPTDQQVTLAAAYKWNTGASKDIIGDVISGKQVISDACGAKVTDAIFNTTVLKMLAKDATLLTLLSKSQFGQGDLFTGSKNSIVGVNVNVLGSILDIPNITVYDELFEVRAMITSVSTTTIGVDDTTDFEVGGTLRFVNVVTGTFEEQTITAVNTSASTLTVDAATDASFRIGQDYVSMKRKYCPDNLFTMFSRTVEGDQIAKYMKTPYGMSRNYGVVVDTHDEWDPDGAWMRVQDKGLPVLLHRDAIYNLTVA